MKKRGRKITSVIDSKSYSQIIFLIASGKNYAQLIANVRGTKPSPTVKQLNELRNKNYLMKPINEPFLNKKIYSINGKKIVEDFFIFLRLKNPQIRFEKSIINPTSTPEKLTKRAIIIKGSSSLFASYSRNLKIVAMAIPISATTISMLTKFLTSTHPTSIPG